MKLVIPFLFLLISFTSCRSVKTHKTETLTEITSIKQYYIKFFNSPHIYNEDILIIKK